MCGTNCILFIAPVNIAYGAALFDGLLSMQRKQKRPGDSPGLTTATYYKFFGQNSSGKDFLKVLPFERNGGRYRTRTCDPLRVNYNLYLLPIVFEAIL